MKVLSMLKLRLLTAIGAGSALVACAESSPARDDAGPSDRTLDASARAPTVDAARTFDASSDTPVDASDPAADTPDATSDIPDAIVDASAVVVVDARILPLVPPPGADEDAGQDPSYPYCFGPSYEGGYWGQCCLDVYCGPRPDAGCPDAPNAQELTAFGYPFTGSGDCACGEVDGPFRGQSDDACCYVAGVIGCTGRPLRAEGALVLAPVVRRADWS